MGKLKSGDSANVGVAVKVELDPQEVLEEASGWETSNGGQRLEVERTLDPAKMVASLPA